MKLSNFLAKKLKPISQKSLIFFLIFIIFFSALVIPLRKTQAQLPVTDVANLSAQVSDTWLGKVTRTLGIALQKAGSIAFQRVIRSALNKIAYDTANYLGSGGEGQKPLFVTQNIGAYLEQIGQEAGGQFIESFVNNLNQPVSGQCSAKAKECQTGCSTTAKEGMSVPLYGVGGEITGQQNITFDEDQLEACLKECTKNARKCASIPVDSEGKALKIDSNNYQNEETSINVCSPSSLEAKVKIGLGLVSQSRPQAPDCTASEMVQKWEEDINQKLSDFQQKDFLSTFAGMFNPQSNDIGIYLLARTSLSSKAIIDTKNAETSLIQTKGWLSKRDVAGNAEGTPGSTEEAAKTASDLQKQTFGQVTGDILVDTANVFLNQLFISTFNNLMNGLGKKTSEDGGGGGGGYENDPTAVYGESRLKETLSILTKPDFSVRADYDILSELSICLDPNNPGPSNCVIDDKFMQAIAEKKTVVEAINEGYLRGDWKLTLDNLPDAYTLRNISILRKYRILPVSWEAAIQLIYANPSAPKDATLMDLISCFDSHDTYTTFSSKFDRLNQGWCQGLIDPNWVLKAPLNKCEKEGYGAQILNKIVTPGVKGNIGTADTLSELSVNRSEDYCADNKTCIKEKNDGSCEVYGYCNEDKRTWNFGADSCKPINNTCQTFTGVDSGQTISYLENTLVYGDCSPESAGCRRYSLFGTYASSTGAISWDSSQVRYLNKNISDCSSKDEGCTELRRVKPTWGSNLVMNSDFSNDLTGASSTAQTKLNDWSYWSSSNSNNSTRRAIIVDASQTPGGTYGKALGLEVFGPVGEQISLGTFSNYGSSLLPKNFQTLPGQSYTVSVDVYLVEGDNLNLFIGAAADGFVKTTNVKNTWQHLNISRPYQDTYNEPEFGLTGNSSSGQVKFYLKNLKFEMSSWDTGYSSYGTFKISEKILPPYLEAACYVNPSGATKDYRLKDTAPAECSNFARKCNKDEVGCELYTSSNKNFAVPAQVKDVDYCNAQCLGYDVYISKESYFNSPQAENLIPEKARSCNIEAAGCSEFTNLDEVGSGGEQKEYYTYLKQCIKPSQGECAPFYTWEGTENGYQLKSYSLKKAAAGDPAVTSDDSSLCSALIYNLPVNAPGYNPDCREFYNAAGAISYHLISRTYTCSDNCHAYRLSEKNIDKRLTQAECIGTSKSWDNVQGVCYSCANSGTWDSEHQACVYQAIPGEGKKCAAAQNGCREYNGNNGNNTRLAAYYDFENGKGGWTSNCVGGIGISTISNNKSGHSLYYNDGATNCVAIGDTEETATTSKAHPIIERLLADGNVAAQLRVNGFVSTGNAYNVKFLARAASDTNVSIYFLNKDTGQKSVFNVSSTLVLKGGNEWSVYQANLENLDHEISSTEVLVISASANFYLDNFVLTEITDRYYLIKNSSVIPDICYYDIFDNYQGADFNLGCSQYSDRSNLKHNLHNFSKLCSDSAVGCEQMIATNNYSATYKGGLWKDTNNNGSCDSNETDCVSIGGHTAVYAVYDESKTCNSADLGCSRLGQAVGTGNNTEWSDVYKNNNPNNYDNILCGEEEVGCEEWQKKDGSGSSYFKDPGVNACAYRTSNNPLAPDKAWYKIAVMRCDTDNNGQISGAEKNGTICASKNDCNNKPCILDKNDYPCTVSYFKTIGLGGAGNQVPVPDQAAGLCEAKASGCTEYIDPVSQFSPNLVYNPSYQTIGGSLLGWSGSPPTAQQTINNLKPNQLYILNVKSDSGNNAGDVILNFSSGVKVLLDDNTLGTTTNSLVVTGINHVIFNALSNVSVNLIGGLNTKTIEVKEAVIDYQLQSNIDKKSCNGLVKFDNGCVLFNERKINGSDGLTNLQSSWDAYKTLDGKTPTNCDPSDPNSCNANQLIKVQPNRVCSQWLDCSTYIQDPITQARTCYAVGECNRLDDNNNCANFVDVPTGASHNFNTQKDKNATGYALLNKYYFSEMKEVGFNTDAHYDFEDSVPALSCKTASGGQACGYAANIVKDFLVREPDGAPTDYPAHGKTYLKVPSRYLVSPHSSNAVIKLLGNQKYFINYLVNTKNSGLAAKVTIINGSNGAPLASFTDTSPNGWERKIHSFLASSAASGAFSVKIELGADLASTTGNVYFDDINIEPVLEVGQVNNGGQYVARECRLYPTGESLTCKNKNNNVISDGLEGYCLEHDLKNPGVCLLWYPVDKISAVQASSQQGYSGKYPLNYCTEVDGSFDIVEKRLGFRYFNNSGSMNYCGWDDGTACVLPPGVTHAEAGNYCDQNRVTSEADASHHCYVTGNTEGECGSNDYFLVYLWGWNSISYYCMPLNRSQNPLLLADAQADLGGGSGGAPLPVYYSGWFKYNGLTKNTGTMSLTQQCDTGPCRYAYNEKDNADLPVRVYDYKFPPATEEGLKDISGKANDNVFRLTCNRFVQTVDSNGLNMAWTDRVGINADSNYPTSTPPYFVYKLPDITPDAWEYYGQASALWVWSYNIQHYTRRVEDIPFGAATWPDNFDLLNSDPIKFRNQYSKSNDETIFAGRPYGCSEALGGSGCSHIGYCSLDPSVYCIYDNAATTTFNVSLRTCADSGYGKCVPLWDNYLKRTQSPRREDYKEILKNLFLKTFNSFKYDNLAYTTDDDIRSYYDGNNDAATTIGQCENNIRPVMSYNLNWFSKPTVYCYVMPAITNFKLQYPGLPDIIDPNFTTPKRGVYKLSFNTAVDSEQLPLREIRIDWGDGSPIQVITGQDQRPSPDNPHILYHFYASQNANINFRMTIFDNWDKYSSCLYNICGNPIF